MLRHGIFHVDLHPGNVLVDADGTLQLFDVIGYGLLIVAAVLTLRVLVAIFRHDRA